VLTNNLYYPLLIPPVIMLIIYNPFEPGMVIITICLATIIIMIIIFVIKNSIRLTEEDDTVSDYDDLKMINPLPFNMDDH